MAAAGGVGKAEIVKKRKRVSKKSKRSWRKHVDITEVEEHLNEVRRQERTGGIISDKKNEELFYVAKNTEEEEETERENKKPKSSKAKRRKLVRKDESSDESDDERRKENLFLRNHKNKLQKTELYDLWSVSNDKASNSKTETIDDEHYLKATKKMMVKQPNTAYKVRSTAPALAVCHPGASYNPTFEDHQELLMAACEVEIMKQKDIDKIKKQLQLPSEEELAKLPSWEEEMSQGLFDRDEDENNESETDDKDNVLILPSNGRKERKTKKDKRKKTERKKEEQSSKEMRQEKVKENEIFRMKSIKKSIKRNEEKTQKRKEEKQKKMVEASAKPQRLGRQKFEEMNIEVQLSNELRGSLRNLKPEGNLFEDRFKTLQRRNIIEPRRLVMPHRKYKLKEYEKRSYKNFDLQEKLRKRRPKN